MSGYRFANAALTALILALPAGMAWACWLIASAGGRSVAFVLAAGVTFATGAVVYLELPRIWRAPTSRAR